MPHNIESIAWANEVPWHGLGTQVPPTLTTDEMMRAAKLDWTVSKRKMNFISPSTGDYEKEVPDFFALVRDSDDSVLDVVGKEYTPVQNLEAFEFFREFVEAGQATMETAGSLKGGRHVWVLANLNNSFKLAGGDTMKNYLLMSQPHQQGKAQVFKFTSVRVVCNNTLTMALSGTQRAKNGSIEGLYRRAHRGTFDEQAMEAAKQALGIARTQSEAFAESCLSLTQEKVDRDRAAQLIAQIMGDDELENETAYQVILDNGSKATALAIHALDKSPGADLPSAQGTLWGVLNAITYTTDHLLRKSPDSRLFNAWFGKEARIKDRAFATLTELAG